MTKKFEIPPLFSLTFFLAFGIILGFYFDFSNIIYFILPLLIFQIVVFYFKKKIKVFIYLFYILNAFIFISIGFLSIQKHHSNITENLSRNSSFVKAKVSQVLKPNDYHNRYELKILEINHQPNHQKVIFYIDKKYQFDFKQNEILELFAHFEDLNENYDFGGFNYANYLNKKGIKHQLTAIKIKKHYQTDTFFDKLLESKLKLIHFINQSTLNNHSKNIILALLLGERTTMDEEVKESFSKTGIIHVLAISGLHIGLISTMLLWLLSPLKRNQKYKFLPYIIAIITLWIYALLVGFSPSVVRAVTMFSFINLGLMIKRDSSIINTISASMFILLIYNPYYIFDVGFQLSYAAVYAIVLFYPIFKKWYYPKSKLTKYFYDILLVSLAAQIGVLPISLYYFHQLPGLFLVANLIAIPLITLLLALGFAFVFLSLFNIEWTILSSLLNYIIDYFIQFIKLLSGNEQFLWQNIYMSTANLIVSMLIIIYFYMYVYSKKLLHLRNILVLIIIFQSSILIEKYHNNKDQFITCQKGNDLAIFQCKNNNWKLYSSNPKIFLNEKNQLRNSKKIKQMEELPFQNFYLHKMQKILIVNMPNLDIKCFSPDILFICKGNYYNYDRLIENNKLKTIILPKPNQHQFRQSVRKIFSTNDIQLQWFNRSVII